MTRVISDFEGTATFKICRKIFFGEITDYPKKIGKFTLLSTDGVTAIYVDKKGKEEVVFITSELNTDYRETVSIIEETGEDEEYKHPLLPFLTWEPGNRHIAAVNKETKQRYEDIVEGRLARRYSD